MADKDKFGFSEKAYSKALADKKKDKQKSGGDFKQLDQEAKDLAYGMDTSKYTGNLRDVIQNKNIEIQQNRQRVAQAIAEDPTKAGFRGFLPSKTDIERTQQRFANLGQAITPQNIAGGIISLATGVPFLGNFLLGALEPQTAQAQDTTGFALNPDTGTFQQFDPITEEFITGTDFVSPKFTPDDDLIKADINIVDRLADAIAAPNISTGLQTLFAPKGLGLPEDFLDQSAVETQSLPTAQQAILSELTKDLPIFDDTGMPVSFEDMEKDLNRIMSQPEITYTTPVIDPGVTTTTPVIDPLDIMTNFFAEQRALPDEIQQEFDDRLIEASAITPVKKPTGIMPVKKPTGITPVKKPTMTKGIPMDRALEAMGIVESGSTPTNVNFAMGDERFDMFGRLRPTAFGPFQIRKGTFEDPGYGINPTQGMPEGTGFFDVVGDYDLSKQAAGNILSGLQEAGETGEFGLNLDPLDEGFVSPEAIAAYNLGLSGISEFDNPLNAPYLKKAPMQNLLSEFGYLTDL